MNFRNKVENSFKTNDSKQLWKKKMQTLTGYKPARKSVDVTNTQVRANELNTFYASVTPTPQPSKKKLQEILVEERISGL